MMMNLADPELELIDPTPNVHSMFLHFDKTFFWAKLSSRCVVRWSKRMYSCAGTCSYEGRGGLCDIALSEPLLKLRPRKDLVETLLHEMIHAFLFVTKRDQDRDGHGPNFQAHMHRINRAAGLNISIYHDFHDEVKLYQTHWWRCNGPCQSQRPYFGIVRRSNNRAPGPSDCWWTRHQRNCGGTFIKIKEPEKKGKKINVAKPNADITKYINTKSINNNNKDASNKNVTQNDKPKKPILKDSSNVRNAPKSNIKANNNSTLVVTKKNVIFNPLVPQSKPVFNGTGQIIGSEQPNNIERNRTRSADVLETVRNVWANKQISSNGLKQLSKDNSTIAPNSTRHKPDCPTESPPPKLKKIDDYFKSTATSVLKDLYGQDFNITQSKDEKLKAIPKKNNLVDCPVCNSKIDSSEINSHLDVCLNKGIIEKLSKKDIPVVKTEPSANVKNIGSSQNATVPAGEVTAVVRKIEMTKKDIAVVKTESSRNVNNINSSQNAKQPVREIGVVRQMEITKENKVNTPSSGTIDLSKMEFVTDINRKRSRTSFDHDNKYTAETKDEIDKKNAKLRKSDSFTVSTTSDLVLNSSTSNPRIKIEPGCSKSDTTSETACPCCGDILNKSVDEHLDECLSFFENNTTIPEEGASTSYETIVIDDEDDKFDESQTFNATGTKLPCPCCLKMVEEIDMNNHLDQCLS